MGLWHAVIDCVDDRFSVYCGIERLAHRQILELRLLKIEIDRLDRGPGLQGHHTTRQFAGFLVMVGGNVCLVDKVDVAALELGVEHRHVRNVFEDEPLDIWTFAEIVRVRDEFDMVAGNALRPLECAGADRRLIEGGGVGVGLLFEDVLGNDEGFGEKRQVGSEGLLHPPGDLGRRDHRDIAHQRMAARAPRAEFRIGDELEGELHILGREGLAVVPADVVTQTNAPLQAVLRNAAILLCGHFGREIGLKNALGVHSKERIEHREMHCIVDLGMRHQRVEDGGFLRKPDDDAAGRGCRKVLRKGRLAEAGWVRQSRRRRPLPSGAARRVASRSIRS